jgi:uncharacterized protein YjbJ (UPF0337 family)
MASTPGRMRPMLWLTLTASVTIALLVTACESGHQNVVDGTRAEMKGRAETEGGRVTGNDSLKTQGRIDQAKGDVQKAIGKTQEAIDHVVDTAVNAAARAGKR